MYKFWSTKIIILILIVLLAPVFSYTIFQFAQRGSEEALIKSIYDKQLKTILFSVNQHCWDMFKSWTANFTSIAQNTEKMKRESIQKTLNQFLSRLPAAQGVYLKLCDQDPFLIWKTNNLVPHPVPDQTQDMKRIQTILNQDRSRIEKLIRRAQGGYVQPVIINWSTYPEERITGHVIPVGDQRQTGLADLAVLFIDDDRFVDEIVARKFTEMDDGNFIFAVKDRTAGKFVYLTDPDPQLTFEKQEGLWVIPDLDLMIKLRGTTLDQISQKRTQRNLFFIVVVNVILVLGLVYLFRNISAEMALAQMKTDFVANVSHELRTPLSLIRMHAETLEMGRVSDEGKKHHYYRTIMNESTRLTQLINNILDFSRIESRKKKYTLSEQDLNALITDTINVYRSHFDQKGFDLHVHLTEGLPLIRIDTESVRLAFVNLLDNAIKFSADRKEVHIDLIQNGSSVVLSVKDFGIGIPESEHRKIFEKFYRVGSSLVYNTRGSGLGLSLVKHIMEVHNGEVHVESKPGDGSRFSLIFPVSGQKKGI